MYRLLIVDDEPIIVEGLFDLFQSAKHLDLDIYRAYSGEEALYWLSRSRIDIVLTDISMPGINGIQLMEEIRKHWSHCRIIFLTAFNDFNYVYAAIQHKGIRYLLKTESDSRVLAVVEETVRDLEAAIVSNRLMDEAKNNIPLSSILQKECLASLLSEKEYKYDVWKSQFEDLCIPLKLDVPLSLVVGRLDEKPDDLNIMELQKNMNSICNLTENYLLQRVIPAYTIFEKMKIAWLIQPRELLDEVASDYDSHEVWKLTEMFLMYILELIQEHCKQSLSMSMSFIISRGPVLWENVSQRFEVLKTILNYSASFKFQVIMMENESESQNIPKIISFLKQYIANHLSEDISLVTLSEIAHFNPSYLSRLFKHVTGINLSDYIENERLCRAKKLLQDNTMKIYEIAHEVGFKSVTYFTRVFKNEVNMTPQKYRDAIINKRL